MPIIDVNEELYINAMKNKDYLRALNITLRAILEELKSLRSAIEDHENLCERERGREI